MNLTDLDVVNYLESYDKQHHSEYYNTLYEYLKNERNLVKTSAEMRIHRNTLVYRLERLQEMFPMELEDSNYRFLLMLNFELRRYKKDYLKIIKC